MYFDRPGGVRQNKSVYVMSGEEATQTYQNYYYVDHTVMTLNSPDIDFDDNMQNVDLSQYNVRIVGYIPFLSDTSKQLIIAENPMFVRNLQKTVYDTATLYDESTKMSVGFSDSVWKHKHGRIVSRMSWYDEINGLFRYTVSGQHERRIFSVEKIYNNALLRWNSDGMQYMYNTYPFQREYLNNYRHGDYISSGSLDSHLEIEDIDSSKIVKKVLGNLKYACETEYYDYNDIHGINKAGEIKMYAFDTDTNIKVNGNNYCGNIDQLVTTTSNYNDYSFTGLVNAILSNLQYNYNSVNYTDLLAFIYMKDEEVSGYPLITGAKRNQRYHNKDNTELSKLSESFCDDTGNGYTQVQGNPNVVENMFALTPNIASNDPILIRYKSGRHAVISMKKENGTQFIFYIYVYI